MHLHKFKPRLFTCLSNYNKQTFTSDVLAGIIVGIVALPLAIAFAIASGVSPRDGIITAIIGGFLVSFFGGSKVQIGGPTGAFIVIVYGVVQTYGLAGLLAATIMAGIMLILLGIFKLGAVVKFIPYPIIIGFTAGIAVTIFTTQVADLLGMSFDGEKVPGDFIGKWLLYIRHWDSIHWTNALVSISSILIIVLTPRYSKRVPGSLLAILLITPLVYFGRQQLGLQGIDTIGDRFTLQASLPHLSLPSLGWESLRELFPVAVTIAVLGAIESLLSATVADGVSGDRHDSNTELIAQGIANIVTPIFGGIPTTGAIARTMTNINNGGRTPIAGIIHAAVLLLILLFLMPLASYIPMACLAGVLAVVSYNMSGWRTFRALCKGNKSDVTVLCVTFLLTVIFDLTIAIEVGLLMACVLFMRRVMETTHISVIKDEIDPSTESDAIQQDEPISIPRGIEVYEINGPYFFGVATKFEEVMNGIGARTHVRIIRMRRVPFIDSTGIHNLTTLYDMARQQQVTLLLSGVLPAVRQALDKGGVTALIGADNVCDNLHAALRRAEEIKDTHRARHQHNSQHNSHHQEAQ